RDFVRISSFLKQKSRLTDCEAAKLFLLGLHVDIRRSVRNRLQLKNPDHHPDDPWTVKEVVDAAIFVISPYTVHQVKSPSPSQKPDLSSKIRTRNQDPEPKDTHQTPSSEPRMTEKPDYTLSTPERETNSRTSRKVSVPEESTGGLGTSYIDLAVKYRAGVTYANAPRAQSATTASKDVISTHRETQDPNTFADRPSLEFPRCPRPRSLETGVAAVQSELREEEKASQRAQAIVDVKDQVDEICSLKFEPHKHRVLKIEAALAVIQIKSILEFLCQLVPTVYSIKHKTSSESRITAIKHGTTCTQPTVAHANLFELAKLVPVLLPANNALVAGSLAQKSDRILLQDNRLSCKPQAANLPKFHHGLYSILDLSSQQHFAYQDPSESQSGIYHGVQFNITSRKISFGFDKDNPATSTSPHFETTTAPLKIDFEVNLRKSLGDGETSHFEFPAVIDLEPPSQCLDSILSAAFSISSRKLLFILMSLLRAYLSKEDEIFKNSSPFSPQVVKTFSSNFLHFQHRSRHGGRHLKVPGRCGACAPK
ncbi:hypothetical protein CVT26_012086, partial [Gymnopilus dilepis]